MEKLINEMMVIIRSGQVLNVDAVTRSIAMLESEPVQHPAEVLSLNIVSNRGRTIRPKTANQKLYVDAIEENTITFGIGPAGTGKTYLAMAKAVAALQAKKVNRIILSRPAVEAGEKLGFLPGTLNEKIDPYLRPLFDALHDMIDAEAIPRLMQTGVIEVAPLAFMRGRTLNDAFIILDEAQNTTPEQMKMFLTRLGFGSKAVVTGDVTQVDLPNGARVMYGLDDDSDRLVQVQILSLVPSVQAIAPHLAAMHERYGPPTGIWDCEPEGGLPTRRFSWRRERVAIADVLLVYGDRVSITLYVTTPERMGASIYRSSCRPTPTDQVERFPTASPEQVQAAQAEGE